MSPSHKHTHTHTHTHTHQRRALIDVNNEITRHSMNFQRNLIQPTPGVGLSPASAVMKALPPHVAHLAQPHPSPGVDAVVIPTDARFTNTVLKNVVDPGIRRSVCVDTERERERERETGRDEGGRERRERVEACGRETRLRRKSEIERDTHVEIK